MAQIQRRRPGPIVRWRIKRTARAAESKKGWPRILEFLKMRRLGAELAPAQRAEVYSYCESQLAEREKALADAKKELDQLPGHFSKMGPTDYHQRRGQLNREIERLEREIEEWGQMKSEFAR